MRLYELTGVKKYHQLDQYDFDGLLAQAGIKVIGTGSYGTVYWKPGWDYVVKVMTKDDPSYMAFVDYAIAHPNPHFPKFSRKPLEMHAFLRRPVSSLNKFWVVKIEKLNEIKDKNLLQFIVRNLESFGVLMWQLDNNVKSIVDTYREKHADYTWVFPDGSVHKGLSRADIIDAFPWFAELARTYNQMMMDLDGAPDIHAGNFMQRDDGTIVIIDPIWEGSNPMKEFHRAMAREMDTYYSEEDEPQTSGPVYKHTKKPVPVPFRSFLDDLDDDIPF